MNKQILFVDDEPNVLRAYERSLRPFKQPWSLTFAGCPLSALKQIQDRAFDAIVTDVHMPGMSGIQLLQEVKSNALTADVPVVVVTGEADRELKRTALDFDAADLLNKPVETEELVARLRSALRTKEYADQLKNHNEILDAKVKQRTAELTAANNDLLWRLGKASEFRDEDTGNHVIRVACFSRIIAQTLGLHEQYVNTLFLAAPLHDIGKIGVPDNILLKPGKLNDEEWDMMRKHCQFGVQILRDNGKIAEFAAEIGALGAESNIKFDNPVISMAIEIAGTHHEKWDGSGYPLGLAGEEIPLSGRIVAIVDVFDALRSERPYKKAFDIDKTLSILDEGAGTHFDPDVHAAFIKSLDSLLAIEKKFADSHAPVPAIAMDPAQVFPSIMQSS